MTMTIERTAENGVSIPKLREKLKNKLIALEQEVASHHHTLDLLRETENAYGRFVPHQLLHLLHAKSILDLALGEQIEHKMTILFADIRDFTQISESMTPKETFAFINSYLGEMEPVISQHGGIVDKYIGDAIMALFPEEADAGLQSAIGMLTQLQSYNEGRVQAGYPAIHIGIGLNTGIVMLGTVGGTQHMEGTVLSDSVNLASRLEGITKIYHAPLLISEHTLYSLKDETQYHIRFLDRIRVKGKNQAQSVYEVFDHDPGAIREGKDKTRKLFEEGIAYYHIKAIEKAIPLLESCLRDVPEDYPAQIYLQRCHDFLATGVHVGTGEITGTMAWSDDFLVGVDEIDNQHKALVVSMNHLSAQIASGDTSGVDETLNFLADYAHFHFGSEERIMREINYPFINEHIQEHQKFIQEFIRLKNNIISGLHDPLYLSFQIQLLMFDWFANHTTKTDRHLGRFVRSQRHERDPSMPLA
jgi:hemerythrin